MSSVEKEVLRAGDIAERLGLSKARVYQLAAEGWLPFIRNGRAMLFPRAAVETWLQAQARAALDGMMQPK
jgi:excisionase family DNA binding protein